MYRRSRTLGSRLATVFWSLVVLAVCLWPTWLWLAFRAALHPEGFWQNLIVVFLGYKILGVLQLVFVIIAGALIWAISDSRPRRY
jgi:RsiW-degrading membrane proteinase PrsW (M82 family)